MSTSISPRDLSRSATQAADHASSKLKEIGVDTDVMMSAAKVQASELQKLIRAEVQRRPFHALAIAAAIGFYLGVRS